ncbi:MAG: beta-lactamase family protein [Candidatus Krumholzibacteriota bacterium]|nr:beta-lactamase family protein [Candidatus Krumholzibacteriota bacterium]
MRSVLVVCAILLAGASSSPAAVRPAAPEDGELARCVEALFAEWVAPGSPGGAVILTDGGEVVLRRCYGLADIEHGVPFTPETRFELASVSKSFTGFAALLLERAGKLGLDDPIQQHLPELPDYGAPITVADLLHHTSGLSDWVDALPYAGRDSRIGFGIADLLDLVARQRVLEFAPGSRWSYSNTNYALLAEIMARVAGRPFGEWMEKNVFAPLGMHATSIPADGARVLPNRAQAYRRGPDGTLARSLVEHFEIPGPAHVFSTLDDMARWADNLCTGRVGGRDVLERMFAKPVLAGGERSFYGAGVGVGEYRGVRTVGHAGQTGGFKSELLVCPDLGVGVVVLANAGSVPTTDIAYRVLALYLGDALAPPPEAAAESAEAAAEPEPFIDMDPAAWEPFLGGYRLEVDPSVLVAVAREGDWLVGALMGEGLDFFRPVAPFTFENRHRNCRVTFVEESGAVARARIVLRGNEMMADRVALPDDASWLDGFPGFYYSDELRCAWEIVRDDGSLAVRYIGSADRPLHPADADVLAGGIGIFIVLRDGEGRVTGFDFEEPEDLGQRRIRFVRHDARR